MDRKTKPLLKARPVLIGDLRRMLQVIPDESVIIGMSVGLDRVQVIVEDETSPQGFAQYQIEAACDGEAEV